MEGARYQASVTAGTIFHKTRVPLRTWFLAIFFLGRHKKGIPVLQLQRDTGLGSYQTAWTMLRKIRSALAAPARSAGSSRRTRPTWGARRPGVPPVAGPPTR
jgi:hypothetical protein